MLRFHISSVYTGYVWNVCDKIRCLTLSELFDIIYYATLWRDENILFNTLWILTWNCLAMKCSVNYTIVWWYFTVWPNEPSGELGSYSERTSDYDINYRILYGKPISINYPFYATDCFWFLNSNLQCQNLLFPFAFTLMFRIYTKQNQTFITITRSVQLMHSYCGKICIWVFPVSWLLNVVIFVLVTEDLLKQ